MQWYQKLSSGSNTTFAHFKSDHKKDLIFSSWKCLLKELDNNCLHNMFNYIIRHN